MCRWLYRIDIQWGGESRTYAAILNHIINTLFSWLMTTTTRSMWIVSMHDSFSTVNYAEVNPWDGIFNSSVTYTMWPLWTPATLWDVCHVLVTEMTQDTFLQDIHIQGVPKKTDPLDYFDDNFSKYGLILTIFWLLQQENYGAQNLRYFSHLTFIMLPLYLAKQTLMLYQCHYYVIIVFARRPFDCPVVVGFWKQMSNTCLRPSLSRKLCY